jgi:ABC-2 type transport system permease protein
MSVTPTPPALTREGGTARETTARESPGLLVAGVILRRELIHFVRQPARVAAAIGTPCLLWLFMASGFAESLRPQHLGQMSYAAYLLPGMMTLVAMFAAIFSSMSLIEDRQEGWLQAVLVSPAPRWAIASGKIAGGSVVAWVQAIPLLAVAPFVDLRLAVGPVVAVSAAVAITSVAMTAVGVALAWRTETTGGYHAVMNLLFMPLWLLSGSMFPPEGAVAWLGWLVACNPLAWCTQSIRGPLVGEPWLGSLAAAAVFAIAAVAAATWVVTVRSKKAFGTRH